MSGGLGRYLSGRIVRALVEIAGVVTLVFLLVRIVPGDPVQAILGDTASPEDRAALRESLYLDRPMVEQYGLFLGDVMDGSLGQSFRQNSSVSALAIEVLPSTLWLALAAFLVAIGMSIPLGVIAAWKQGTRIDRASVTLGLVGLAVPTILLGPLLILGFSVEFRWLPLPGDDEAGVLGLVLPAITIGTALAAVLMRQTRRSMVEVLQEQYIVAARARGLSETVVLLKHALRNGLLPVITVGAAQLGALLTGTVIAEKIFERQGLGTLFLEAFFDRDIPVVQGCVLIIAATYVVINLVVDIAYGAIDPRVRLS